MYKNYLVRISTTKRVLTGFSTKIKIKKITERINFFNLIFVENPVKTLLVVEIRTK
jgi:hypothetical protein